MGEERGEGEDKLCALTFLLVRRAISDVFVSDVFVSDVFVSDTTAGVGAGVGVGVGAGAAVVTAVVGGA